MTLRNKVRFQRNFSSIVVLFVISFFSLQSLKAGDFDWNSQVWKSDQEREFWMAIPDWGKREPDHYLFRYSKNGDRVQSLLSIGYNGYAKGYFFEESIGFFKFVVKVEDGWVVLKKVWHPNGNNHILRSYVRGTLNGRYIDWHDNGFRAMDGFSKMGNKSGLWKVWYPNGQLREEGYWGNGQADGIFEEWYMCGKKAVEQVFDNGKLISAVVWKPSGERCKNSQVVNGEGVIIKYDKDGKELNRNLIISGKKLASR